MLCASRSSSGPTAISCSSSARLNPEERASASRSVRAFRRSRSTPRPASVTDRITRRPSSGSEARASERGTGGRPAAVEAGERRRLGQAELIARGYLTQAPEQQSDAQAERRRDLLGVDLLDGDFISLV